MDSRELLALAAAAFRGVAHVRRDTELALANCSRDLAAAVLAAVEGLEVVATAVTPVLPALDPERRESVEVALSAAWERLAGEHVALDGSVGEPLDLSRHRVLRRRQVANTPSGLVMEVLTPGVTHRGIRLREALVTVSRGE
jgi:molecular chaperone GrpE (heat shock protein)